MPKRDVAYPASFVLADVARLMRVELDKSVTEMGLDLSAGDIRALMNIVAADGIRQCDLAKTMNVEPMTISAYLDRLERNDLVRRQMDPMDRRARVVYVSDLAKDVLNRVRPMLDQVYEQAMNGIDPRQRESTETALEIARSNLSIRRGRDMGATNAPAAFS